MVTFKDFSSLAKRFRAFLDSESSSGKYRFRIHNFMENPEESSPRIILDIGDLREYSIQDVRALLCSPNEIIPLYEETLREYAKEYSEEIMSINSKSYCSEIIDKICLGFCGPFGYHRITPRELMSSFLSCMIRIEGVVTKVSTITPKLKKSVQYSPASKMYVVREFSNSSTLQNYASQTDYPQKDDSGNFLETEYGLCLYSDLQFITIQEATENAPPGQLPRSVDITLENDLVDLAKPGDRISVVGVYREIPRQISGQSLGLFKAEVIANNIEIQCERKVISKITLPEIQAIRNFVEKITQGSAKNQQLNRMKMLMLLSDSLAPSIYGHDMIKRALILQLVGGVEKILENGTKLRGDINILLIGDPGVAKSQLLRSMIYVCPIVISTTGRGSSGVGLTAVVLQDKETGERRLEAGAMVLADRGIVLIDEFDKMSDIDRVTIHEVMEQQTVTVTKAGLHTTLNARCSVLAAANPIYGCYDSNLSASRNINLPDSLLSRFDILFIMVDQSTHHQDTNIAHHVISMRTLARPISVMSTLNKEDFELSKDEDEMDLDKKFFSNNKRLSLTSDSHQEFFKPAFIGKFVSYCRNRPVNPTQITPTAQQRVISFYTEIRQRQQDESNLPITARTLETIIRISTANAKLCLDHNKITEDDVMVAEMVLRFALYGENLNHFCK